MNHLKVKITALEDKVESLIQLVEWAYKEGWRDAPAYSGDIDEDWLTSVSYSQLKSIKKEREQ